MTTIADIERAMVERLKAKNDERIEAVRLQKAEDEGRAALGLPPLEREPLALLRLVAGYGGQLDSEEAVAQAFQAAPAAWALYDGEADEIAGDLITRDVNMAVMALASSYNPGELRRGGAAAGIYQIVEQILADLSNQSCGLDMSPLRPRSVNPLWRTGPQGGGFSLVVVRFSTQLSALAEREADACPEPALVVNWRLWPFEDLAVEIKLGAPARQEGA